MNKIIIISIIILSVAMIAFEIKTDFWKMEMCKWTQGEHCFGSALRLCSQTKGKYCYTNVKIYADPPSFKDKMTLEERKEHRKKLKAFEEKKRLSN